LTNLAYLQEEIAGIPAFDAHTHLDIAHLCARGLHDILLYHMVISDLYSAGCPDGARLSEEPDENEALTRLERAIPYVKHIQNTSCFWMTRMILKDIYGWDEPITQANWMSLHELIKKQGATTTRARDIMKKANIVKSNTELWRGRDGSCDDFMTYSLEWCFFTRAQWGRFDSALLELEHGWKHDSPVPPLPVTTSDKDLQFAKKIGSVADVKAAMAHYISKIPYDKIITIASHFSTDVHLRPVNDELMEKAIRNRANATSEEQDIYASYVFEEFLKRFEERGIPLVLQFSMAAEPLPFETGSKMRSDTPFELAGVIAAHPNISFNFHVSNMAYNQVFCTMARELPNLSLNGYWWHNFFPSFIPRVLSERLDMVALNKQVGFFTDAYCMEWSYAKSMVIRRFTTEELAKRVDAGQFDRQTATYIASQLLGGTAAALFGVAL